MVYLALSGVLTGNVETEMYSRVRNALLARYGVGRVELALRRALSAQQAAVALRPFYFVVHPDRFSFDDPRFDIVRVGNEKALQTFNGYLSGLFPHPSTEQRPVTVAFAIRRKGSDELERITMQLSGGDAGKIVRLALEKCHLSTSHLPATKSAPAFAIGRPSTSSAGSESNDSWRVRGWEHEMSEAKGRLRKKSAPIGRANDLLAAIRRNREEAIQREAAHKRNAEALADEVESVVRRTGVKKIVWLIDWDQSYMRRCLTNIRNMLSQADSATRETIVHSLYGYNLMLFVELKPSTQLTTATHCYRFRLGRGSYVCCDGSLQFGADDATGAWMKVCMESMVRRFEVANLEKLAERVSWLFGGRCRVVINPHGSLLTTTLQLQAIIVRISSNPQTEMRKLREIADGMTIEIANAYSELAVMRDGRLQIPCNVAFPSLLKFLLENVSLSHRLRDGINKEKVGLENLRDTCRLVLGVRELSWEGTLNFDSVSNSLERLCNAGGPLRSELAGLSIHLSSSPTIQLLPNGKISIPTDWV